MTDDYYYYDRILFISLFLNSKSQFLCDITYIIFWSLIIEQIKSQNTNRHKHTLYNNNFDIIYYFVNPTSSRQKQYAAVRALVIDKLSAETVANMYNYKISTVYLLLRDAK